MYVVEAGLCVGCGKCAKECPNSAISVVDKKAVIDYEKCTCCGTCAVVCSKRAVFKVPRRLLLGGGRGRRRGCWRR